MVIIPIPDPIRKRRLGDINKYLTENKETQNPTPLSKAVGLMLQEQPFQKIVANSPALSGGAKNPNDLTKFVWAYLINLISTKDKFAAAQVLWDQNTFCAEPQCVRLIWNTLASHRMICIIGGGAMSKTFSPSAYFLLEYILDPEYTRIQVASASQDHLLSNLFRDIAALHSDASIVLPGAADSQSITTNKRKRQGIFTLTLPAGSNGKSKIKGSHPKPRPPHPLFGNRTRVFCIMDEGQECADNAFAEIPNRFSSLDGDDIEHLKFCVSANPRDIFSKFGRITRPIGGWQTIGRHTTQWMSDRGWAVISLDQTQHENYIARKKIFAGFATYDGVQEILRSCDGDWEHPIMYSLVFGKFPPEGTTFAVIKQRHLLASEGDWTFNSTPIAIAGLDPAFTSDRPALAVGRAGMAIAWTDASGEKHVLEKPKMAIQIDSVAVLGHGDSQELADEVLSRLKDLGVKPSGFGADQTGPGRGVVDIIRYQWSKKVGPVDGVAADGPVGVHGIEYASAPSSVKIAEEDSQLPKDRFDRIASELWYSAAKLFEFDSIRIGAGVDLKVMGELSARKGDMQPGLGKKLTIETKDAYKQRTKGQSPDLADATLVMIHVARMNIAGLIPRAKDTSAPPAERPEMDWGESPAFPGLEIAGFGVDELPEMMRD